jgi:hypothetical protein
MKVHPALFHFLTKTTSAPPTWALGRKFEDGLGNEFMLVLHNTPTAGVACTAGSPVGQLDGGEFYEVTTDLSQSDVGKLVGMNMVDITAAESLAGETYHWVMTKGAPADYASGGRGVPLGDSTNKFNPNVNPIAGMLTDGTVADAYALYWQADNTWGGTNDLGTGAVPGGWAKAADTATNLAPADAFIDVGRQVAAA